MKEWIRGKASVRRLSSLLGLAALACLFSSRRHGNNSTLGQHMFAFACCTCLVRRIPQKKQCSIAASTLVYHSRQQLAHMPIAHLLKESVDQLNNYTPSLTWKISRFWRLSGVGNSILRSSRPGRSNAGSSVSCLLVAIMTCVYVNKWSGCEPDKWMIAKNK